MKKSIPYPTGLMKLPLLFWEYLEYKKGTNKVIRKKKINPLYFVPIAKPHRPAERARNLN